MLRTRLRKALVRWTMVVVALSLCTPASLRLAHADMDSRFETWHLLFATIPIGGAWSAYIEAQPRITIGGPENHRLLLRPALRYRLPSGLVLWAGYAWTPTFESRFRNENRFWQQAQMEWVHDGWTLNLRSRFEQRLLADVRNPGQTLYRFRQWIRILRQTSLPSLSVAVTDEAFFHLNSVAGGARSGFDQNRLFLGLLTRVSDTLSVEGGYLNNFVNLQQADRMNHVIYSFLMLNLR